MGGVDRMDQNISKYRIGIKGKKWYFSIVLYIIDLAVQNAWQLHMMYNKSKVDQLVFRRTIVSYIYLIYHILHIIKQHPLLEELKQHHLVSTIKLDMISSNII